MNGGFAVGLTIGEGIRQLQSAGAKITSQRMAIMHALEGRSDHPSAERLYRELKPFFRKLSIATVYSTVRLLAETSMVRMLSIDDKKVYFDPNTEPHGHFMCKECKAIADIPLDFALLHNFDENVGVSSVDYTEVFHYGTCTACAEEKKNNAL